jgi:hypothetical protein
LQAPQEGASGERAQADLEHAQALDRSVAGGIRRLDGKHEREDCPCSHNAHRGGPREVEKG